MPTNPIISGEPAPGGACRVCGGKLSDSLRCSQCGAAFGEANRCPHCGSVADIEAAAPFGFRCRVCGGPRVPVDDPEVVRSGREIPLLKQSRQAQLRGAAWRVGAGIVGAFGLLSFLVTLAVIAVVTPGLIGTLAMLGASAVPFVVALLAWRRGQAHLANREQTLENAWSLVAGDVLAKKGEELTASDLATLMRVDTARAEKLLANLSVSDFVHARVTEEGDLAYSVPAPKLRVAELENQPPPAGDGGTTANSDESIEQEDEEAVRARARARADQH